MPNSIVTVAVDFASIVINLGFYSHSETRYIKIIDVTGEVPVEMKGVVPARSVVIPGSYTKKFAAGEFQVPCALIIGKRKPSTDLKTSLNDALRTYDVAV